jgi:hypothetical protein
MDIWSNIGEKGGSKGDAGIFIQGLDNFIDNGRLHIIYYYF